jgi:hypothetical protein
MHQGMIKFEGGPDEVEQEKFYIEFISIERNKTQVEIDINKEKEEIEKKSDKNLKNILDIKNNNNDKKD